MTIIERAFVTYTHPFMGGSRGYVPTGPGVATWASSRLAAIRQVLDHATPRLARVAFTGVVACAPGVAT